MLLGSVNHALKFERSEIVVCQPIPLEASCHIADHIQVRHSFFLRDNISERIFLLYANNIFLIHDNFSQVILGGFAEQSKTSVVHMCSLFHAFILCQLWTVYLEQTIAMAPPRDEAIILASSILLDFWGKVTPGMRLASISQHYIYI